MWEAKGERRRPWRELNQPIKIFITIECHPCPSCSKCTGSKPSGYQQCNCQVWSQSEKRFCLKLTVRKPDRNWKEIPWFYRSIIKEADPDLLDMVSGMRYLLVWTGAKWVEFTWFRAGKLCCTSGSPQLPWSNIHPLSITANPIRATAYPARTCCQLVRGLTYRDRFTPTVYSWVTNWTNLHVFGLWEEVEAPGRNQRRHKQNTQTPLKPVMLWVDSASRYQPLIIPRKRKTLEFK